MQLTDVIQNKVTIELDDTPTSECPTGAMAGQRYSGRASRKNVGPPGRLYLPPYDFKSKWSWSAKPLTEAEYAAKQVNAVMGFAHCTNLAVQHWEIKAERHSIWGGVLVRIWEPDPTPSLLHVPTLREWRHRLNTPKMTMKITINCDEPPSCAAKDVSLVNYPGPRSRVERIL